MNVREQYMLNALKVIAACGKGESATVALRPYMSEHKIRWHKDDDVKAWLQRIAEDAIRIATKSK